MTARLSWTATLLDPGIRADVLTTCVNDSLSQTAAYTAADSLAHANVICDFSASVEFLGDVQVTAAHPASSQHWLVLI